MTAIPAGARDKALGDKGAQNFGCTGPYMSAVVQV